MATKLQDLQAKRKELQATNPNATMLDAKSALSPAPIANAPVAGQAPAITPIAPTPAPVETPMNANKQILANNQAKVASEIQAGTRPEVGQQPVATPPAPITPAPVAPAPVTPTPTPVAPVAPAPEVKTPKEPKPTEVVQPPATVQGIFTALATKADIPDAQKALPSYKIAQNRFTKANMYSSMTPAQLAQDVNDAKIVEGSPAWEDIKMLNPKLVKDVQNLNTVNGTKSNIFTYVNNPDGTKTKENNLVKTFVSDYEDNYGDIVKVLQGIYGQDTAEEARAKIYTPDVKSAEDKATQIELEMNALSDTMAGVDKDVEKELAGTGATGSRIALEKQYRNEQLTNKYNSLQKNYTTYANKANNLITQNTDLYKSEQENKKALQTALAGVALKNYGMQAEADFAKKQAEENLNNPAIAIENVMNEYKKLGIPFTSTIQSRLQEFANSGKSLPDYLTQMTESIQASPAYQQYKEMKAGELTDREKMDLGYAQDIAKLRLQSELGKTAKTPKWAQDINGNWYNENSSTSPAEQIGNGTVDIGEGTLLDVLGKNVGTYTGNRGYDLAGNLGDPLPAGGNWKVISTDTAGEQVGSIFKPGKGAKPYGNTVVMEDENGNQIRYSHLQDIGVQPGDTLSFGTVIGTRGNTGNVLGANGEKLTAEQLAQGRGAHVDIEIKDKSGRLLSNEEQKNYLAGIKKPESTQNLSIYRSYVEDGKLPSKDALKGLGMTSQQFIDNADAGYTQFLDKKAKEISDTYPTLDIAYTPTFASNSATQKEKLNDSITKIGDIDMRLTKLKKLFDEYGTEVLPTKAKAEMDSLRQQIILKAKEVENLGVLNGPDLGILENLLPATTGVWSGIWNWDANTKAKLDSLQNNYRSDAKTKAVNYGAKLIFADAIEKELANSF